MKRFLYLGVALFLIVFEAVPEGLALAGHKTIAGIIEFVFLAGITLTVFAYFTTHYPNRVGFYYTYMSIEQKSVNWYNKNYWYYIAGYILLRFALFDIVHNLAAGLPVFYIGITKWFDVVMSQLASWGWFMRFVGGIVGLTFLLKK